ncbi:MAG: hypothetical protein K2K60_05790, partial [Clostridia bacterium]|nr:hypothetical protein [Clostridia bacterium]
DIIISALKILGRADLAQKLTGSGELTTEESEKINTLLYCYNAVEDEVARCYIPLSARQNLTGANGQFYYSNFVHAPVKIKRVTSGGKRIAYEMFPLYLKADATEICVEYEYSPRKKVLEEGCEFFDGVGEHLFACGTAAEYCLINGEVEAAALWESKYRQCIDEAQSKLLPVSGYIPPRRWV